MKLCKQCLSYTSPKIFPQLYLWIWLKSCMSFKMIYPEWKAILCFIWYAQILTLTKQVKITSKSRRYITLESNSNEVVVIDQAFCFSLCSEWDHKLRSIFVKTDIIEISWFFSYISCSLFVFVYIRFVCVYLCLFAYIVYRYLHKQLRNTSSGKKFWNNFLIRVFINTRMYYIFSYCDMYWFYQKKKIIKLDKAQI